MNWERIIDGLAWFFGVSLVVAAWSGLNADPISAIFILLLGIWVLPPVRREVYRRFPDVASPRKMWGIGLGLLFLAGVFIDSETSTTVDPTPQNIDQAIEESVEMEADSGGDSFESGERSPIETEPASASEGSSLVTQSEISDDTSGGQNGNADLKNTFRVRSVIDGDTFVLETGETVRLIGINTPERGQYYYEEAAGALRTFIGGMEVTLVSDVTEYDRYDRRLAYVYIGDRFINEELVRGGFAKSYAYEPDTSLQSELSAAEDEAIRNERGMWQTSSAEAISEDEGQFESNTGTNGPLVVSDFQYDSPGNDNDTVNEEYFLLTNTSAGTVHLTRYRASDAANHEFVFPNLTLQSGASVRVRTGVGVNTASDIYWGSDGAIWNNGGDTLYLRDRNGGIVLTYSY